MAAGGPRWGRRERQWQGEARDMCSSPLPCFLEEVRALGELGGCGAGCGDMEPVPLSRSGCSPETKTKYALPLQGIPHGSPGKGL